MCKWLKKRVWLKVLGVVLVIIMVVVFAISRYFLKVTTCVDRGKAKYESEKFLRNNGIDVKEIKDKFEKRSQEFSLRSRHDHCIRVRQALVDGSFDNTTMVLVHGHEMDMVSMYPIANFILENGINVVLYDQRAHGGNTSESVTFGYYEKDDLEDVVNYICKSTKGKTTIGLLGQSMGAATCGFYIGEKHASEHIKFAVLDCPYNNMKSVIKVAAKKRGYADIMTNILLSNLNILNRVYLGFWHEDMDICNAVSNSDVPVLIYAMKNDRTCPIYMAQCVFDSIKHSDKDILKFEEGGHIRGFYKNNEVYVNKLLDFVNRYER